MSDLTPQETAERLRADADVQLIDVREPDEHEAGRIAGDRLIALGELTAQAESIDRDRPVIFYCRSGARSAMAADAFGGAGYEAHNLAGGLQAWDGRRAAARARRRPRRLARAPRAPAGPSTDRSTAPPSATARLRSGRPRTPAGPTVPRTIRTSVVTRSAGTHPGCEAGGALTAVSNARRARPVGSRNRTAPAVRLTNTARGRRPSTSTPLTPVWSPTVGTPLIRNRCTAGAPAKVASISGTA